ncbi:hypothetical protein ACM16X_00660 [Haloarcula japonica]|uniref:hypothetical protein n=1 Tax=Haloarcula japonica TaxID=29282 RepID=UPI0039F743F1
MTVSQATKKKLFATSGNECACPDCEEEVVDREEEVVIGVIAHIHARSENGPRFDPSLSEAERDEFSNLMVLCPNHHTRIDKNPDKYPPEKLKRWKEDHEKQTTKEFDISDELIGKLESDESDPEEELVDWTTTQREIWQKRVSDTYSSVSTSPYSNGYWLFSYKVIGDINEPTLRELRETLRKVKGSETGWPPWCGINEAKPMDGEIEVWLNHLEEKDAPERADFWRASTSGELFLLKPYREDHHEETEPGKLLDYILPIWHVGESLLHAKRFARRLSDDPVSVAINIRWDGLKGRELGALYPRRGLWPPSDYRVHRDEVEITKTVSVGKIENNLSEVVYELTIDLYQAFDFYEPDEELISNQIKELTG